MKMVHAVCYLGLLLLVTACWGKSSPREAWAIPPGEHPRLLFTQADLPRLRAQAQTPDGQRLLLSLRQDAFGGNDELIRNLEKNDPTWMAELRKDIAKKKISNAALVYQLTGDQRAGWAAAELFRLWLATFPPNDKLPATLGDWGEPEYAMAYDWVYDQLTKEDRLRAEKIFAVMVGPATIDMYRTAWWMKGPHTNGRDSTNWTAICCARLALTNMALEGRPGYNPELQQICIDMTRNFLNDGIAADGAMTEGVQYPMNYGMHYTPYELMALRLRGVDLITTTHLSQAPLWFTYEMLPWGGEAQAINKSNGGYQTDTYAQFLANEFGGLGDWVYLNSRGYLQTQGPQFPQFALISGIPFPGPTRPDALPLFHWFSTIGKVISRSGWGPRDAHFTLVTNQIGAGHTHGDHGSFTLAAHGVNFIADSGYGQYASVDHNLIHIDGLGQSQQENATEAYIRSAEASNYADVVDADLKLAYDRLLVGPVEGPWHWEDYNPVAKAERRALFVRGLAGPITVIADDIQKDSQAHTYDWPAHTMLNNRIAVDGRHFTISERYGGSFIEAVDNGQQCALVGQNVPNGRYRGWLLVRGTPAAARTWSNTTTSVNGKRAPYNTTFFAQGGFSDGWFWVPIMLNGAKGDPGIDVTKSELRVDFTSVTGAQVALAAFTRDANWTPDFDIPANGGNFVVLGVESLQQGEKPWTVSSDPLGVLDGVFLGKTAPQLRVDKATSTQMPVLHAEQRATNARYLCVMVPSERPDARVIELPENGGAQVALIRSPAGVDIVGGAVDGGMTTGDLTTNAMAAVVSLRNAEQPQSLCGYALASGSTLRYRNAMLVEASANVSVINDGTRLILRGPGGASVLCATMTAKIVVYNGVETALSAGASNMVRLVIPRPAQEWQTKISPDGLRVEVTGDGPLPLKIAASKAVDVRVNGVSRYFTRDEQGAVWPLLSTGMERYLYSNQVKGEMLQALVTGGKPTPATTPRSRKAALQFADGNATLTLKTFGPGRYQLTLGYATASADTLQITLGDARLTATGPTPDGDAALQRFEEVELRGDSVPLVIRATKPFLLTEVRLAPALRPLPANQWMTIGPFPSPWGKQMTADNAKIALTTVFPPERELNLDATYEGSEGKPIKWQHTDSTNGAFMAVGANFAIMNGVKNNDVCYAVTYLVSPDDRNVQMQLGCDYWANVYVNGQLVPSDRSAASKAVDGANFNGPAPFVANFRLHKGVNTLLVKCQSGSGGSSFLAAITNPGDLQISPRPPAAK
ncbi:MAG TPA: hypothetical protein VGL77_12240 [Armatimonadota bacterium]